MKFSRIKRYAKRFANGSRPYRDCISEGMEAIKALNKSVTGHESHEEVFFDECGNKRKRLIPKSVYFVPSEVGCVNLYQIAEDGQSSISLHDRGVAYKCIKSCIEVLRSYKS